MGIMGIFIPLMKELKEMAYQYDRDYYFDSAKFESKFGFTPTSPGDCIRAVLKEISTHKI